MIPVGGSGIGESGSGSTLSTKHVRGAGEMTTEKLCCVRRTLRSRILRQRKFVPLDVRNSSSREHVGTAIG